MDKYSTAVDLARDITPSSPVFCLRPHAATAAARWFVEHFPGKSFYAVKANPSPWLIEALVEGGIRHFDVASIAEVRLIRDVFPDGTLAFMHPVKAPEAITEAYFEHGVRIFSLDSERELEKIMKSTGYAGDLTLCVRMAVSSALSKISLASKFGVNEEVDGELLQKTRQVAERLGVCFHVGSQSMSPTAYAAAMQRTQRAIVKAGVVVDVLDVGGGFPSAYPGMEAPALQTYVNEIATRFEQYLVAENCELWCEPGRALSAESASLIVRVESRKDGVLYINDGTYGALFDAGTLNWTYPMECLTDGRSAKLAAFEFYGPTCDDHDHMKGPYYLPEDIEEGDHIEIGMLGAYGSAMRTGFNGFGAYQEIEVADAPMLTMYGAELPHAANDMTGEMTQ
ncbi:type III PLP-dependent enzyme [Aquisalinus flavus]|uniref:ornithine decarboxylase n=1 Tax=Aquisalinus flavus TaxID=1526572 RepID=A0A8J2V649_9PROT|nr:type III PLP-dependent enzyme [Aquisalinus flavus]MBD0427338.1 type III PLP-dependent enzyme [Aquisalinus flavus]UNE47144.1 type III PLP-dependent enzyme [Aquisalinus flavus]GGD00250.1 ornithine decarboxylase [Aquisalinus flavus]